MFIPAEPCAEWWDSTLVYTCRFKLKDFSVTGIYTSRNKVTAKIKFRQSTSLCRIKRLSGKNLLCPLPPRILLLYFH